jgi:hypothetical protein
MVIDHIHPLERLSRRLHLMGKVLGVLCCAWIAIVGSALLRDIGPENLEHHRAPAVQEKVKACEGEYARRYACTDAILLSGERNGASQVLLRLGLTLMLPTIAWTMWNAVMEKADRLTRAQAAAHL